MMVVLQIANLAFQYVITVFIQVQDAHSVIQKEIYICLLKAPALLVNNY